jgi:hypothetical protein
MEDIVVAAARVAYRRGARPRALRRSEDINRPRHRNRRLSQERTLWLRHPL